MFASQYLTFELAHYIWSHMNMEKFVYTLALFLVGSIANILMMNNKNFFCEIYAVLT